MDKLIKKLKELNITGKIVNKIEGPSVILCEFKPDEGIKLSKFSNIEKDIAMELEVEKVRIIAPIPGKSTVGIEIPRKDRQIVYLREIIESDEYKNLKSCLAIALGKTIENKPFVIDLKNLPHLLIAGSTGSGKSICLHSIILSILFKVDDINDVRFVMIDPKMIEFSLYEGLPLLAGPVITEVEMAKESLELTVKEMENRYKILSKARKRDLSQYRKKKKLPYIVVIIDELADLMMTAGKEVETLIARLAQKGRAAGIHLIIATQRPSVDIITGVIKNNLPARISFKVASNFDSRTIIDTDGAENLLGKGDMLYLESGKEIVRIQGCYVSEKEIERVVKYLIK